MIRMPVTMLVFWVAFGSLLLGFLTGWHGLFHVSVWGLVAIFPALLVDAILATLGVRAPR